MYNEQKYNDKQFAFICLKIAEDGDSKNIVGKVAKQPKDVTFITDTSDGLGRIIREDKTAFIYDSSLLKASIDSELTEHDGKINIMIIQ
jgi:hypothetical protein